MEIDGANVILTGASRGIGRATVDSLLDRGARIALVARSADRLAEIVASVGADRVAAYPCDLADPEQLDGLVARIERDRGPTDVLVNNAGLDYSGPFATMTAEEIRAVVDVNLIATMSLCRQAFPGMLERRRGHVVNVSSIGGAMPSPGVIVYCATKAGISQFTAGLRAELKGSGVGTTLVEIGPVETEMIEHLRDYDVSARSLDRLEQAKLSRRLEPAEVARGIVTGIATGRRHVRLPKRQASMLMLAEAPRRVAEWLTLGLDSRPSP